MNIGKSKVDPFFLSKSNNEQSSSNANLEVSNLNDNASNELNQMENQHNHESIEMEEVPSNPSNLSPAKLIPCNNKEDFLKFFDNSDESINNDSSKMIKFKFADSLPEITEADLQIMKQKFQQKSIVLMLTSEKDEKFAIFWKSKEIDEFLEVRNTKKLNWKQNLKLCEHVAEFLVNCLKNNHLGLRSELSFHPGLNPIEIDLLADSRNYNLLLLGAECGNLEMVEIFLDLKMYTTSWDNKVDCQSLAMEKGHEHVVYRLMLNNLTFPTTLNPRKCTGQLKEFCNLTDEVYFMIKSKKLKKLAVILSQHSSLCHFYDFDNKSALRVATESKSFDVYNLLLSKNFRFGSHENPSEYYEKLNQNSKFKLQNIHNKHSQPFPEHHIHALLSNSRACFDEEEVKDKRNQVQRAFELLNENPFIKIILKIVATAKNLNIVFDFNREAVNILDPVSTKSTQGICYFSGKIFVGAKQLLDPETENVTLGVLAHELCHFAMSLVYKNDAKPYKEQDKKTKEEFEETSKDCKEKSAVEEVIGIVYELYPVEAHHAELIVRVVHLMALYRNLPEKLAEMRETFIKLFNFYETKTVPELEKALPELEGREEKELKIKDKKISNLRRNLFISIGLGIIVACMVGWSFYTPIYKFSGLYVDNQKLIFNASIKYKGVDLKLSDLFPENSTVFQNLTSEHISQIFRKKILDFSDPHLSYLDNQISHKWENLTPKLKDKVLGSEFIFQNESLKFESLYNESTKVFNYLSSDQLLNVLNGKELKVHEMIKNESKFYLERKFVYHNAFHYNFDEILKIANESKLFILSGEAGTGKTVTFEQMTMKIKKKFPTRWVSYIDLKDFKHLYREIKTLEDVKNMLETIFKLSSENEFEKKIFENFFEPGSLNLLWNGFDEISPEFSNDVIRILELIRNGTENIQFLCTRPLYSKQLVDKFSVKSFELIPYSEDEQKNFIRKYLEAENIDQEKIPIYLEKVRKAMLSSSVKEKFDTPLMLGMFSELISSDVEISESLNLYEIYQKFVEKKIEIWNNKSEFGKQFIVDYMAKYKYFDIMKLYQSYAIKSEILDIRLVRYASRLKVMHQKVPKSLTSDEISRMGILYINGQKNFKFAHRTFSEFFVAQYLIENVYNTEDNPSEKEAEFRATLFFQHIDGYWSPQVIKFLNSFLVSKFSLELKPFNSQISKALMILNKFDYSRELELFIKFFKKDHKLLKAMLQIDENETLYTRLFDFERHYKRDISQYEKLKNAAKPYLTEDEFQRFLTGRFQKGKILFHSYVYQYNIHDIYKLNNELMSNNDPYFVLDSIAKSLTQNELKELFMSRLVFEAEKYFREIFNEKMWKFIEVNFNESDQKDILDKAFENCYSRDFLLKNFDNLTSIDISDVLQNGSIFSYCGVYYYLFDEDWKFFVNHTSLEQQKNFLKKTEFCNQYDCYPIGMPFYLLTNETLNLYESYFNESEIQKIILSHSSEMVLYIITKIDSEKEFEKFCEYLKKKFQNNKKSLREFLERKIEPTNLNIFELLGDYNVVSYGLKVLSSLLNP